VAREPSRWIRSLLRLAAFRASDAELGDVLEEYAGGRRGAFWLCRQILSTQGMRPSDAVDHERRHAMLSNLWGDVRYAIRTFRRQPAFAAAAVVPIALGIGINTGIFSILNSVAFRGLPAPDAAELVSVHQQFRGVTQRRVHGARSLFSTPEYRAYRDGTQTLSGLMAYSVPQTITLGGDSPREADAIYVTCNYFDVLKLRPAIGAGFSANCESAAAPEVIVSHDLWTQAFAANRAIVGSTITVNGRAVAVAGVAPEGFDGTDVTKAALFAPVSLLGVVRPDDKYRDDPYMSWLTLVGRRTKDAELTHVRAELAVIASQIDRQQPGRTTTVTVAPATALSLPVGRRDLFSAATVVLGAFGLVLLLACANVANLLLARAAGRTKEIAVRLSVGASRRRLIQLLLTESALIALIGGVAGVVLAWWSFRGLLAVLLSSLPGTIPPLRVDATPNATVLWFALGLTVATAFVFGLVPALQASKQDVQTVMKQEGASAGRRTTGWLRASLVGAQIAVSMVLLISAGLLLRALYAVQTVEPGFDYRDVAVVSFDLRGLGADQRAVAFRRQFIERVEALPGVDAVAQVGKTPLSPGRRQNMVRLPGQDPWQEIDVNHVSPGYFALIGIPIVRGRAFTATDAVDSAAAAIVTEATARRLWPGQDPIGQRLMMSAGENQERPLDIVGVAKDAQVTGIADTETTYVYLSAGPREQRDLTVLIRSDAEFAGIAANVRAVARDLEPGVAVRVNRLEENLDFWRTVSRLVAGLSGSLSLLALTLASVGVYGVVSFVVSRRRREVGIRIALGATPHDVQRLIVRQTLRPVAAGVLIGIAGAAAVSRILHSVLFGVSPFDPVAFVGAPLFLLGIALAATLVPTREALRVDPVTTLRCD
jgi:putative ABC transport system permease protein